jgi:Arc/MetJ family transcription regulator
MSRMTVTVDEELLEAAQEALGAATKAETIRVSLAETVRRNRLADAATHRGKIAVDLDQASLAALRDER